MTVGIIGMGYVGLPLAVAFAEAGVDVVAVDIDGRKVEALARGESHVEDVPSEALRAVLDRIEPTTRYEALAEADAVLICVPTPLSPNREPELGPLLDASAALSSVLRAGQLVVLESTTYPGTTRERLVPVLQEAGPQGGPGVPVALSPGRGGPRPPHHTPRTP